MPGAESAAADAALGPMRLRRLGAFFPTRLSFMRVLLRRLAGAQIAQHCWQMDDDGYGHAVYTVSVDGAVYSLVAFSTALPDKARSDRVIAEAWDSAYVLYDGVPDAAEIARLRQNAPRQEAGRYRESELVLSRANKSVRFFNHTVERLAAGKQPDDELVVSVGYLMRTTAVYGNGKFGIADRAAIAERPLLQAPFQAELLAVYLIRQFTFDLVEHIARRRAPQTAACLAPAVRRYLGIGNATGLGMAPFLVNHPLLLHQWAHTRAQALAFALAQQQDGGLESRLHRLLQRAQRHVAQWNVADEQQQRRIATLRRELADLAAVATPAWLAQPAACRRLAAQAAGCSLECQELVNALLLEATPAANRFADSLGSSARAVLQPEMTVAELRALVARNFGWALAADYSAPAESRHFWYVSAEKLEPRLGDRYKEGGSEKELPLDVARRVQALAQALERADGGQRIAEFLLLQPAHRDAARRVQTQAAHCCSEIEDNLIGEQCRPIDMLRFKLSFFGACKFDPKSALWTRIALFQGAPTPDRLGAADADDWWLPVYESNAGLALVQ